MVLQEWWRTIATNTSISFQCSILSNVVFWSASLVGLYADHLVVTNQSPLLKSSKLQPTKFIQGQELRDLIHLAAFNMLLVSLLVCCPLYEYLWDLVQEGTSRLVYEDVWDWQTELLVKLPICMAITDFGFYFVHYQHHASKWCYQSIHRVHHRFPAPTAMACVYAHPLEFAVGNLFPVYLGPILTNAHPMTCYLWFCLAMLGTCKGHSGYRILGHADYHNDHHYFYRENYGGMFLSDCIFGTLVTKQR